MVPHLPVIALLHGACALLYGGLASLILIRHQRGRTAVWLAGACLATAVWAASVAIWPAPSDPVTGWLGLARSAAWCGFILHLYRRTVTIRRQLIQTYTTMALLALLLIGGLTILDALANQPGAALWSAGTALKLGFAVANILLLENLYFNTPVEMRWHINVLCIALGGMFLYDLFLYADALLFHRISGTLFAARAPVAALASPLIAVAVVRDRRWAVDIHVSRDVVFHSATLVLSGIFLLGLAVTGEIARRIGANWGSVAEVSLLFGGLLAVGVTITSASARSRIRSLLVDHFFSHRYDYRKEWMHCIEILTAPVAHTGLSTRAIRAVAEVVDSPAGALFVRAPDEVAFQWAGSWNMPAVALAIPPGHALVPEFRDGDWIVEIDRMSAGAAWFEALPRVWLAVPLNHLGTLIGFVVLAQSRAHFKLDREAYDLLRVVGREVASRVAEQRAAQVLLQTRQLREYSQRFAFVLHDIKNVSGQLSMLLTNAEIHADNPEFQRDMLATVRASVGKISRLLSRLQAERQERTHSLTAVGERLRQVAEECRATCNADIILEIDDGAAAGAAIHPESFDTVVTHVLNNAVEASGGKAVVLRMRREALSLVVDIVDQGPGMTPEFIRDRLFQPFASTKSGGHGIGAFQARELLREAGGDLLVLSRPRHGTTMRLLLPAVSTAFPELASLPA
ncbi:MAG TPA: XrtA/PEP-CTERM system histidine kinase PrsK [Acetobacteraceae bacterium]|nr:XrtA/PEP-CTERM system histidine kinase PrsK [Acetobacteraceae bacterium]